MYFDARRESLWILHLRGPSLRLEARLAFLSPLKRALAKGYRSLGLGTIGLAEAGMTVAILLNGHNAGKEEADVGDHR
jgi:hypothetical protein